MVKRKTMRILRHAIITAFFWTIISILGIHSVLLIAGDPEQLGSFYYIFITFGIIGFIVGWMQERRRK